MSNYESAVRTAVEILQIYSDKHGPAPFPVLKDRLSILIAARAASRGVDNIYVKRFKEEMRPIVGQIRRIEEANGAYQPVEQHAVVYLCPSLDLNWQRFLQVKETSHLMLDDPSDYVVSETDFDRLMVCLAQFGRGHVNKHYLSEQRALVCAIELLFPKVTRDALLERYLNAKISPEEVATAARIPIEFVKDAMSEEYREMIDPVYAAIAAQGEPTKVQAVG